MQESVIACLRGRCFIYGTLNCTILGNGSRRLLRMRGRKKNGEPGERYLWTCCQSAVPWRCSPRFRPGGRFQPERVSLSDNLASRTGREGEKCRPLDHVWQIPFIHSARFLDSCNFYIYRSVFYLFPPFGTIKCVLIRYRLDNWACVLAETPISLFRALFSLVLFHVVRAGSHCCKKMAFTHAHLPNKRNRPLSLAILLKFY